MGYIKIDDRGLIREFIRTNVLDHNINSSQREPKWAEDAFMDIMTQTHGANVGWLEIVSYTQDGFENRLLRLDVYDRSRHLSEYANKMIRIGLFKSGAHMISCEGGDVHDIFGALPNYRRIDKIAKKMRNSIFHKNKTDAVSKESTQKGLVPPC